MPALRRILHPRIRRLPTATLLAAGALAACMAQEDPAAALRAAQADSAAAGYPVGAASDGTEPVRLRVTPLVAAIRRRLGLAEADSAPVRVVAIASRAPALPSTGAPPATPVDDSAVRRAPPTPAHAPPKADTARIAMAPADTAPVDRTDASPDSAPTGPSPDSTIAAGDFLAFNPARRSVQLTAIAGLNGVNESLNINGVARGARTFVVPLGWRVEVRFRQGDDVLAHSALVAPALDPLPIDAPAPAFEQAATRRLAEGMIEGATDAFSFVADRAGAFVLQCGVPGHAQGGEWLRVVVDPAAAAPRYR